MLGGVEHSLVVGDDSTKIGTEVLRGRQMDRVERPYLRWTQNRRRVEDSVVDPDEFDAGENGSANVAALEARADSDGSPALKL